MLRLCFNKKFRKVYFSTSSENSDNFSRNDYQYLQNSKVPTLHFQRSLPRLPIPSLSKSCERYLRAQKPLTTAEEYLVLEKLVKELVLNEGPILQKELKHIDSNNEHTSYISAPWFEMYLKDRKPLPINYNPFLVLIDDPKEQYNDQLIRATNLLISSLRFMKSLKNNNLEPEVYHLNPKKSDTKLFRLVTGSLPSSVSWYGAYLFKAFPLDMSQYNNLFNASRIPERGMDRLFNDPSKKHIMVMKNGNIFKVNVLDESGSIYEPKIIYASLKWILDEEFPLSEYPIGVMTTLDRDKWADARKYLENLGNKDLFQDIDGSIFNLVFDTEATKDYKQVTQNYLHSNGTNRWFDKSFSLIVQKNGIAGINFEHSWGDGVAVLRYFNEIFKDSTENPQIHPYQTTDIKPSPNLVQKLDFFLDDKSKKSIDSAKIYYSDICSTLDVNVIDYCEFGRALCKPHNLSPDSIMQLAFQMAYYKLNGKYVSTYESCSTAAFKHGRTETVRPCTVETKAFNETVWSREVRSKENVLQLIKACSSAHANLIKEAAMGQGFDRHFFALHNLAQKKGNVPQLFSHPLHQKFNYYVMSTSTLSSDILMLGAFGPTVSDGFGIGYTIRNERLGSIVTSYKEQANGSDFVSCLQESLDILYNILK